MGGDRQGGTEDDASVFAWLQGWYARHCDGEWEHHYGVTIQSADNPGWVVTIDLAGTELVGRPFAEVKWESGEGDWVWCFLRDGAFSGGGGPHNLAAILAVFRDWAEGIDDDP